MGIVLDWSAFQCKYAYPSPCQMVYDRVAELHQAGEIDGVIARVARGIYPDVRFPEFHAELGARGVPLAGYGVFDPYKLVAEQIAAFKATEAQYPLVKVGKIKRAGDVELILPGMSKVTYAALVHGYLLGIGADTIYSSKYLWELLVGNQADGWHGNYFKWVANYTTGNAPALPVGWSGYLLWQYSESGDGSYYGVGSIHVDLNRWHPSIIIEPPPDPDPTPIPPPGDKTGKAIVAANYRAYPVVHDCTYQRKLVIGETLVILGERNGFCFNDWLNVKDKDGVRGWCIASAVEVVS